MFLNETMHPCAQTLTDAILAGKDENYTALEGWRKINGYRDEATADLYARIEDAFDGKPARSLKEVDVCTLMSRCLWANDKEFPHG